MPTSSSTGIISHSHIRKIENNTEITPDRESMRGVRSSDESTNDCDFKVRDILIRDGSFIDLSTVSYKNLKYRGQIMTYKGDSPV